MKFKTIVVIALAIFLGYNLFHSYQRSKPATQLAGIWQDSPAMAEGWGNRFHIFSDGRYSYVTSDMNCANRLRQIDGKWEVLNNQITMTPLRYKEWRSGKSKIAEGICITPTMLTDYEIYEGDATECKANECLLTPVRNTIDLTEELVRENARTRITFAGVQYWKMDSDPGHLAPIELKISSKPVVESKAEIIEIVSEYAKNQGYKKPTVTVDFVRESQARGSITESEIGNGKWFAAVYEGVWTVVHMGNGMPKCEDVAKYQLPTEFLNCI